MGVIVPESSSTIKTGALGRLMEVANQASFLPTLTVLLINVRVRPGPETCPPLCFYAPTTHQCNLGLECCFTFDTHSRGLDHHVDQRR